MISPPSMSTVELQLAGLVGLAVAWESFAAALGALLVGLAVGTALDAAKFYAETFPDSAVGAVHRAPGDYPAGKQDNTHFNELGARKIAELVLEDIRKLHLELATRIATPAAATDTVGAAPAR